MQTAHPPSVYDSLKKWNNEQFARAELMMGANHIRVLCFDGITRTRQNQGNPKRNGRGSGKAIHSLLLPGASRIKCDNGYRYLKPQTGMAATEIGIFRRKYGKDSNRFQKTILLCFAYLRLFTQEKYYAGRRYSTGYRKVPSPVRQIFPVDQCHAEFFIQ